MAKQLWLVIASALIAGAGAFAENPVDWNAAFMKVDRPLVSSLAFTKQGRQESADEVYRLNKEWGVFYPKWSALRATTDPDWEMQIRSLQNSVNEGLKSAQQSNWHATHEALEKVRKGLRETRLRAGFDFYLDRLTAYHAVLELTLATTAEIAKRPATANIISELSNAIAPLHTQWGPISAWNSNIAAACGMDDDKSEQVTAAVQKAEGVWKSVFSSMNAGDAEGTLQKIRQLQPVYAAIFLKFR